jgi:cytochrome c2
MKKAINYILITILLLILSLATYLKLALPDVGPPENVKVELTPNRIARGRYLANSVSVCMDCHSKRDWTKFSGPLVEGTLGQGGEIFDRKFGFPGLFYSSNLTPEGIGSWTDGELLRAIGSGVNKNGKALFPIMPHANYGKMEKEDLFSIIAYLRTLTPIKNSVPQSEVDFPMNFIINTIPKKAEYSPIQNDENPLAYGAYLFTAAACADCHTKQDKGKPIAGMELAGGFEFPLPTGGVVLSANITSDKETGIGKWTEEAFVKRFKSYADSGYVTGTITKGTFNTVMPWMMYSKMSENDLKAIFQYLQKVKPISNSVEKFRPNI